MMIPCIEQAFMGNLSNITNAQFLKAIFRNCDGYPVVCGFPGDPGEPKQAKWFAKPVTNFDRLPLNVTAANNTFFAISTFLEDKTFGSLSVRRRKSNFALMPCFFLDDIGNGPSAKINASQVNLPPSWVIETSPHNYQVGYILAAPLDDRATAECLLEAMVSQGLLSITDPGMRGVTRYGRLPEGANGKAKYIEQLGESFPHKLRHWSPGTQYSLQEIVEAYGLDLGAITATDHVSLFGDASNDDIATDPYLPVLNELKVVKSLPHSTNENTWVGISCPWHHEHTGRADTGAAYRVGGGFKCHHGHCQFRNFVDLKTWLHDAHGVDTEALDRSTLPNKLKPLERFWRLCSEGFDDLAAYVLVLDEYGDRGTYSVIWSAVEAGLSDETIFWLFDRSISNQTGVKRRELTNLIENIRDHFSSKWSSHSIRSTK